MTLTVDRLHSHLVQKPQQNQSNMVSSSNSTEGVLTIHGMSLLFDACDVELIFRLTEALNAGRALARGRSEKKAREFIKFNEQLA